MNIFISFIGGIGLFLNSLLWIANDGIQPGVMLTSLGGLLNLEIPLLHSIELFSIWQLIVTAIGFQIVGQLSKPASIISVIIIFVIQISLTVIGNGLLIFLGQ